MTGTSKIKAPQGTTPRFQQEGERDRPAYDPISHWRIKSYPQAQPETGSGMLPQIPRFSCGRQPALASDTRLYRCRIQEYQPEDFTEEDFLFSQEHMRFVSGCYGLLRPLDLIKPYRMEFDVKIPELGDGNMYAFWKDRQTNTLIHDVRQGDRILLNLASLDIQPSFQWKEVERSVRIITPEFKIWKNGKAETIVIYAKMCRGQMSRYLIKNRISDPEALKAFTWEGFSYKESMSEGDNWVFLQE